MKAKKTVEYNKCDFCNGEDVAYHKCNGCGKDVCYDCQNSKGVQYRHALHFSGSDDGFYCHACDATCRDDLHRAYQQIMSLRAEEEGFFRNLKERADKAEAKIKTERRKLHHE